MSVRGPLLLLLLLGVGCGVPARVETLAPRFDGTRVVRLRGNLLPTPATASGGLELNVERVDRRDQEPEFALLLGLHTDRVRVRPGESLLLLIGRDSVALRRDLRVPEWDHLEGPVREQARYPCDAELLRRLADASEARIVVAGAAWRERRRLSAGNLAAIQRFVREEVDPPDPAAPAP